MFRATLLRQYSTHILVSNYLKPLSFFTWTVSAEQFRVVSAFAVSSTRKLVQDPFPPRILTRRQPRKRSKPRVCACHGRIWMRSRKDEGREPGATVDAAVSAFLESTGGYGPSERIFPFLFFAITFERKRIRLNFSHPSDPPTRETRNILKAYLTSLH